MPTEFENLVRRLYERIEESAADLRSIRADVGVAKTRFASLWQGGANFGYRVTATLTITVRGCSGIVLPGATVISEDAIATTDGSGVATLTVPANGTTVTILSNQTRLNNGTASATIAPAGTGTASVTLTAASGYHCTTMCVLPLVDTLNVSDTRFGTLTLSWNGTDWTGTLTVNYAACAVGGCAAVTGLDLNYKMTTGGVLTVSYHGNSGTGCPIAGAGTGGVVQFGTLSTTCVPFNRVWRPSRTLGNGTALYCFSPFVDSTDSVTITE